MNPVQSDKKLFLDNAGVALSNGYIYVGQPGTDPRTNPKTVTFQDAGGSQFTAQQPLRTLGGKIVYNGQPITALVDGEHSLMIRDSADNQVDYSASVNIGSGGGSVDLGDTIRVGLVLDDVKAFDVSVGDVVRSVGKLVATDSLGADWLVISATGGAGDDVDLIDFDNGLQGQRDKSKVYRKEGVGVHILDTPDTVVSTGDATAYRSVWTSVDLSSSVPATAHAAIVRVDLVAEYSTTGVDDEISVLGYARMTGSADSANAATRIGRNNVRSNSSVIVSAGFTSEFTIKLDGSADFDIQIIVNDPTSGANNTTPDLSISVVGYIINQE